MFCWAYSRKVLKARWLGLLTRSSLCLDPLAWEARPTAFWEGASGLEKLLKSTALRAQANETVEILLEKIRISNMADFTVALDLELAGATPACHDRSHAASVRLERLWWIANRTFFCEWRWQSVRGAEPPVGGKCAVDNSLSADLIIDEAWTRDGQVGRPPYCLVSMLSRVAGEDFELPEHVDSEGMAPPGQVCGMETPKKDTKPRDAAGFHEQPGRAYEYFSEPPSREKCRRRKPKEADETFGVDSTGPQRSEEGVLDVSGPKDSASKVILNLRAFSTCEDGEAITYAVPKSWDPFREAERLRAELANARSELQRVQKAAVGESDLRLQQAMLQSKVQEVEEREDAEYLDSPCGRMSARFVGFCHTLAWYFGQGGSQPSGDVIWSPRPHLYESGSQKSLYPSGGPVTILSGASCQLHGSIVERGFTTLLVEYYSSGCPHCWYFAPVFQQVAEAYKGSDTVRVAACNCVENVDACDAMQIFRYPTLRAYKVGKGMLDLLYDVPHFTDSHQKSSQELVQWLSERSGLWTPPHPQSLKLGAVFRAGHAVAVDGPPGKTGWAMDYHLDDERFVEARLGLLVLLKGYSGAQQHPAAVSITSFVSRVFPRHTADFHSLAVQIQDRGPVQPWEMRRMLKKWESLFGQREHVFCEDETCAVWQLLHVVAASVAAVAVTGQPLAQHGSWTVTVPEAMSFFRLAISEFFTCEGCRQHFLEAFDRCFYGSCLVLEAADAQLQARQMVWWLWRTHNAVSLRVLKEHLPAEGQAVVDRRWPAYRDCPGCWKAEVVSGGTQPHAQVDPAGPVSIGLLDAPFDLDRVFGYILSQYVGRENLQLEQKVADSMWRFPGSVESTAATTFCACMLLCLSAVAALRSRRRPCEVVQE
ncbi:Sulfhydryl oxidase 1 [Symbiodinium microadriaticum]|uniref:Sulfhydryl oxidase n=1 Tax=Symbiodinium microadriaticum TaxID=2951 RepID=A0A1Q9CL09_SYMMI|nr:Sulfhydryl oxidase 1 [Symbiodinium microadriaticum]